MSIATTMSRMEQAFRSRLAPVSEQARAAWRQRTAREQTLLRWGALLLAAALVWLIGLQPALERMRAAHQQLPLLQAQSSRLDAVILEAQALDRGRSGMLSADETEQALRASLVSAGLDELSRFNTKPDAVATWQIHFTNAPAGRLIQWLSSLPYVAQVKTVQVDLARSNVDGRDRPGQLTGAVVLAMPSRETP
ncbi:type II secretion system protein GspM [Pusillimonas sp.]|uniref:type II secretion system protein GspM n=1 Tax=Pusillimonas sp. TaxID=3040095 RepID=UPI0037C6AB5F